jgi:hypothetical protein
MPNPTSPDTAPASSGWRRKFRRFLLLVIVVGGLLFVLYTWAALTFVYASGERAGYVQKFSRKGWICKTWEGELAMANLPGAMPEVFHFTVRDAAVADQITQSMGQRVAIHYNQHRGLPTTCFGDTGYFVNSIQHVEQ